MTYQEYVAILRARWKTVVITFASVVAAAAILSMVIPPHYKATASVVADLKSSGPLDESAFPSSLVNNYQGTQIEVIGSDRVARMVIQKLRLNESPELLKDWRNSFYYKPDNFVPWAVEWLDKKLVVEPVRDSNVVNIRFSSKDPQFAVDAANAFADAYIETNLQLNVEPAKNSAQWFEDLSKSLRSNLETAQGKLSAFQQANGIVATDDRIDVETTRLTELEQQLVTAQGMSADSSSRQSQTSQSMDDLPEVLQNPLITSLKTDIAQDQAQLDDLAARLGTSHPQYLSMASRLASLRAREATEVQRVVGSIANTNRVSVGREAALRTAIAIQKARVLQLRAQHDQAEVLQRDVEAAQHAYDVTTQKMAETTLQGQLQQTNVAVLSKAVVPYKPSWPKLWLDLIVSVFLGGFLGVGFALLKEYLDMRIHSEEQLAQLAKVPAFAVTITGSKAAANDSDSGNVRHVTGWSRTKAWIANTRITAERRIARSRA